MSDEKDLAPHRLGRVLHKVAPALAGALGGPLAESATRRVSEALFGHPGADVAAMEEAILAGDPQSLLALRQAETAFGKAVLEAGTSAQRIAAEDRANARARQIALRDVTPALLGVAVIGGFFFVLAVMLDRETPPAGETAFSIMLGALATMTAAVVNFYFGSSADSREKTQIMARGAPKA